MFELSIRTDNAAFEPENGTELARILHELANRIYGRQLDEMDDFKLFDENGNMVGVARMKEQVNG